MQFKTELIPGKLIKRYKRFLCDVELTNGEIVTAHCANSGAMTGLKDAGIPVWLSLAPPTSKGKLKYRWELAEVEGGLVGINTSHPNTLAHEAIQSHKIPELSGYNHLRREVKYGTNSRVDLVLEDASQAPCYVEVKNVHLKRQPSLAEFPDSVTERGTKHLKELSTVKNKGARSVMLYVIQRMDCDSFTLASDIDEAYGAAAHSAKSVGVEFFAYSCHITLKEITLDKPLRIIGL